MAWTDWAAADYQRGAPLTMEFLASLYNRERAAAEHPVLAILPTLSGGVGITVAWTYLYIPKGATSVVFEVSASAGGGTKPSVRLGTYDGTSYIWGAYADLTGKTSATRTEFPGIPVTSAHRGKVVLVYAWGNDLTSFQLSNFPSSDATHGYGIRFG
jgi:hypothetical protein